ncbi:phosphoadenosine phosphosulfate reductase family protein [Halalkalicoccus jeotgali]|uniref:Phosphoadenosine phosphosulfate reductase n=1 Tax=Halalkalicoccus jeotgali (strain DSM 18796 / CECT 7217 / JCM 14584 / KCTC 4019 / B3) TaxID=795797 RepID=D8J8E5_HALJB|nr:phosphoadenosine phosphosulfate reductase [Halalkalicoccus jeotgali B3]ELY37619.1 phosphoadenosine phosphosulfate reductase [Halalkalicoccus jeotgali B3]
MAPFPTYLDVDYSDGEGQTPEEYPTLDTKLEKAIEVTRRGLEQYENPAVMWTGGKDSTLVLYFVREVAREFDLEVPPVVFIDHFEHFPEVLRFVERWADEWGLDLRYARNEEFVRLGDPGDEIPVEALGTENERELRDRLGHEGETFVFSADSYEGNHLLKTVALNSIIREEGFDGVFSGVRWDEQAARADETFFSPRHDPEKYPPHDRIHSILQFDEAAVWDAMWTHVVPDAVEGYPVGHVPQDFDDLPVGVEPEDLPVSPKYFEGFRSLGSERGSARSDDRPAWLQDLDGTTERAGRSQDKEDLMGRLRDLGYM